MANRFSDFLFGQNKKEEKKKIVLQKPGARLEKSRLPAPAVEFAFSRGMFASVNQDLLLHLERTRDLSRYLTKIDPFLQRYMEVISVFVVGQDGLKLEPVVTAPNGKLAERVNNTIRKAWLDWSKEATYDTTLTFAEAEQMVIRTIARDGEALVRMVTGKDVNKYGFALQILDPTLLDVNYNTVLGQQGESDRIIIMGIEFDRRGRPIAYHVWNRLPSDITQIPRVRERVPADEILHIFDNDIPGAVRSLPWTTAVLNTVSRLNQYLEAHLQACSIAATTPLVMTNTEPDPVGVDDVSVSNAVVPQYRAPEINLAYSQILELDHGKNLQALNLQFPSQAFQQTTDAYLKSIAAGLFISYATLTADPSQGNSANVRFSSIVEREHFQQIQRWLIKSFHMKVYKKWIESALLYGAVTLPSMDAANYYEVAFRGTRHSTIDPSKDMKGYIEGINNGLYTRTQVCAELGTDFISNIKQLAMEEAEIEKYGVNIVPGDPKAVDTANAAAAGLVQTANDAEEYAAGQAQDLAEEEAD
jgi:lambda family phage portal protein